MAPTFCAPPGIPNKIYDGGKCCNNARATRIHMNGHVVGQISIAGSPTATTATWPTTRSKARVVLNANAGKNPKATPSAAKANADDWHCNNNHDAATVATTTAPATTRKSADTNVPRAVATRAAAMRQRRFLLPRQTSTTRATQSTRPIARIAASRAMRKRSQRRPR